MIFITLEKVLIVNYFTDCLFIAAR